MIGVNVFFHGMEKKKGVEDTAVPPLKLLKVQFTSLHVILKVRRAHRGVLGL